MYFYVRLSLKYADCTVPTKMSDSSDIKGTSHAYSYRKKGGGFLVQAVFD